ncbi:DUF2129 domain-containing protein [Streptococcus plurextorum]|uniref:DUF2129 domain-containing protein n=1 Tax=Streptococcus plurextorum TaxID=456876 RepID=UPI00041DDFB6|nr:DUF2129 domain-containing protein [Streptococcus plurextorum]
MLEIQGRVGLAVYLYYNRDVHKLTKFGDILYHSKKLRYVILYVNANTLQEKVDSLQHLKFIKKVLPSQLDEIDQNFVGNLYNTSFE